LVAHIEGGTYAKGFREYGAGPKKDEVTGEWRRLHNENLYSLYSSQNIIWVIKSRIMRWTGLVACMELEEVHTGF
jgi:hypothetical protein